MDDPILKGAWIASTKKHIDRLQFSPEVSRFGATEISGKAGNLLALLCSDQKETVTPEALENYLISAKIK